MPIASVTASNAPSSQIATLYGHNNFDLRWSEFENFQDEADELEARMEGMAIVHRLSGGQGSWATLSVTINSVLMRGFLTRVFQGYQGFDPDLVIWTFEPPFQPLVHRWAQLKDLHDELKDDQDVPHDEKQAADSLVSFLDPILAPSVGALKQTCETGKISYKNIWHVFPSSELIVTTTRGVPVLGRVLKYKKKEMG
ncbi:hypothetical protein INS49_006425 [Diaporthe citri]|uniref:uncharacterized protein n=1 Tax=Diaporthe citri TaxID=83186 RepID=UPI001C8006D8|nr:uncharacterized protein INS49_006425 [Diaporthe citri]KAG6364821.1 hypothetical protein INS49_006425 [Diaporthe citri]